MVAITNHLRAAWPPASDVPTDKKSSHPPSSATHAAHPQTAPSLASRRRNPGDSSRLRIEVHGLDERETMETLIPSDPAVAASNGGPTRDDSCTSSSSESEDSDAFLPLSPDSVGTARILRRWRDWIRSDFVVLPCDISPPPSLPLVKLLNRHRNQTGSLVTSLWYEKSEVELRDADGESWTVCARGINVDRWSFTAPESVLVGYDKKSQELLMVQPLEELEDDLELRISLLNR